MMARNRVVASAIGGGLAAVLAQVQDLACFVAVTAGGALAVYLALRGEGDRSRVGYGYGALTGVCAGAVAAVLESLWQIVKYLRDGPDEAGIRIALGEATQEAGPDAAEAAEAMAGFMSGPGGLVIGLVFVWIGYLLLSSLGGVIGIALFNRNRQ